MALLLDIRPIILQYDLEEISSYLRQNFNHTDYKGLLSKSKAVQVTKTELKKIEEQFYIEQARFKLAAIENTHVFSDKEILSMRLAKNDFESEDVVIKKDVQEIWRKIEKLDQELTNFSKHYLMVSMDFLRVHHEVEILTEKKNLYSRIYNEIQNEYKRFKLPGFLSKLIPKKKKSLGVVEFSQMVVCENISKKDVKMSEEKLEKITQELNELQRQYLTKANIYNDMFIRAQEINEKKRIYSEQLCNFLSIYR